MSKTSVFTTITPLPAGITRESVLETYHNHVEMIDLNPLVVERFTCKPPSFATAEEFHAIWYTIKDKVSYLPGGLASGSVSYHACFHDLPEGLQTHVYAPLGLDIHAKWTVGGNLPGEPKQPVELGLGIPREGLYIREDVRMKCNIMMISFVKKTFKESHSKLVDRLVEKAHILESKAENERLNRLRDLPPGERMGIGQIPIAPPPGYHSPAQGHMSMYSNGSGHSHSPLNSPSLSHASTLGSQSPYLGNSIPDSRLSYYPDQMPTPPTSHPPEQRADPQLTYLPDRKYDPQMSHHNSGNTQHAHPYQQYRGAMAAELPSEAPPVPSKDQRFRAELPG